MKKTLFLALCLCAVAATAADYRVYIGGYTSGENFGINYYDYDSIATTLHSKGLAVVTDNPTYLVANAKGTALYCVNETASFEGSGTVSAFSVDTLTGKLREISKQPTEGTYPCHLTLGKKDKRLVVANYGSGSAIVFPVDKKTYEIGAQTAFFQYEGTGPNAKRQEGPHAHSAVYCPDFTHLYCCDLGTDTIHAYEVKRTGIPITPAITPKIASTPGAGPRHIVFHPQKTSFAYVLNELDNTISLYHYHGDCKLFRLIKKKKDLQDGRLEAIASWSTLPKEFEGDNLASAVRIHPNGKFLYASNRGHDSIATFAIDTKTGELDLIKFTPTEGKTPRDFAISPDGHSMIVANQDSNTLVTFRVDPKTGELISTGTPIATSEKPTCVLIVPLSSDK